VISLRADPANPAQFFGACGFLELSERFAPGALSRWADTYLHLDAASTVFEAVVALVCRLRAERDERWTGEPATQPFDLADPDGLFRLRMDWWETREGGGNTIWKCFAAQMRASDTTEETLALCRASQAEASPDRLFSVSRPSTGRLGFDPRSAWAPLDAGFSPNDHPKLKDAATFPFAELLSSIAVQTFPFQSRGRTGWYAAWRAPLPLVLARAAATARRDDTAHPFTYSREMRGKGISALSVSRPRATD
jgi:CRISPR-associated protein Csb3